MIVEDDAVIVGVTSIVIIEITSQNKQRRYQPNITDSNDKWLYEYDNIR
jgi:hypothetical protein